MAALNGRPEDTPSEDPSAFTQSRTTRGGAFRSRFVGPKGADRAVGRQSLHSDAAVASQAPEVTPPIVRFAVQTIVARRRRISNGVVPL